MWKDSDECSFQIPNDIFEFLVLLNLYSQTHNIENIIMI